ncbi:recombinase family protein [Bacillus sp. B-jedd]|uniref:recombinase family protein n=1 Tax=Bacillus sp. B-jedd TaxID=1476857 RepID=UPI00051562EA|nr:recombinase family protein [Bacillus sp. B-jedd]CEG29604.1 site-specific recombinase for integration and excision [Bacillus sp. B-jedd]
MSPQANTRDKYQIKKVAVYIRVSTEEQAKEGYSISAQKQRLKAYCIAQDWNIAGFYVDEGISAKNMQRDDLQRMLQDIKAGLIDCVLVYRLDRLTRSVLDLYKMLEIFDEYDCKFKSATEVYDTTTAMGRMFITIVAALAQWERENTGERVSMGFHEKTRQGKYPLNFRPYGYDLNLKTGELTINNEEAEVVRLIYDFYLNKGMGAGKICKYLNQNHIPTRRGNTWIAKPLMQILKNTLYSGTFVYGAETLKTPVIIEQEKFDMVQETIKRRRTQNPKQIAGEHIFTGVLRCHVCGHAVTGYRSYHVTPNGEKISYKNYRCLRIKTGQCKGARSFSERNLENAFLDFIRNFDFDQSAYEIANDKINMINKGKQTHSKESILKDIEKLKGRIKKWQYAWANEQLTDDEFMERMDEERTLEASLQTKLLEVEPTLPELNKAAIKEILANFKSNWHKLEQLEKRSLVQLVIKNVSYYFNDKKEIIVNDIEFY